SWGHHKATNAYRDVRHIVIVGLHQAPLSAIIGMVHGTLNVPMDRRVSSIDVDLMRMSEMRSDLLQAIGRGATRNMIAGDVPSGCSVDIIASSRGPMGFSDPFETLAEMFPGARIEPWEPTGAPCSTDAAVAAACAILGDAQEAMTTMKELAFLSGYAERTLKG